jgi:hypothetical protein
MSRLRGGDWFSGCELALGRSRLGLGGRTSRFWYDPAAWPGVVIIPTAAAVTIRVHRRRSLRHPASLSPLMSPPTVICVLRPFAIVAGTGKTGLIGGVKKSAIGALDSARASRRSAASRLALMPLGLMELACPLPTLERNSRCSSCTKDTPAGRRLLRPRSVIQLSHNSMLFGGQPRRQ